MGDEIKSAQVHDREPKGIGFQPANYPSQARSQCPVSAIISTNPVPVAVILDGDVSYRRMKGNLK